MPPQEPWQTRWPESVLTVVKWSSKEPGCARGSFVPHNLRSRMRDFRSGPAWTRTRDLFLIREGALLSPRTAESANSVKVGRFLHLGPGCRSAEYRRVPSRLVSALVSNRTGIGAYSYCVGSDPGRSSARPLTQAHRYAT